MNKVKADLKGKDFDKKLVWHSFEGIDVQPFYRSEDTSDLPYLDNPPGEYPFLRGIYPGRNSWFVRQDIEVDDPAGANKKALDILNRGITSLGFIFRKDTEFTSSYIDALLDGIYCQSIEINFAPQGNAKELLEIFSGYLKRKGIKSEQVRGAVEADPLGRLLVNGSLCTSVEESFDYLADLVKDSSHLPFFRVIAADGSVFSNSGSGIIQELAFSMAMGNEYLARLTDRGIGIDKAASSIGFKFGIGSNYFMEIARMRAARILWAKIVEAYGPESKEAAKIYIHSVTGEWNKTVYDPYVNMLRTQTEAMSATLGGTNSLTVKPFDSVSKEASEFSERIARNQQLLLMEESHFDKVNDPSAGSYYIENLTSSIAEHAWDLFLETEEKGGFMEAVKEGFVQGRVKQAAEKRRSNIRRRKEKLLGTNIFPNEEEKISTSPGDNKEDAAGNYEIEPLIASRAAVEFEELRMAVDRHSKTPEVFLLTIGNPVMRKARAQFAHGFFGCAGYSIADNLGFDSAAEGVKAAEDAGADIVVLCSSDDEYATIAPEVNSILGDSKILVIAGEPSCRDELEKQGIDHFISMRSNLLETLMEYNRELGIS